MFPATVTYVDIPKGRDHISTVFLRPNTVIRYGAVERVAVEVHARGEIVAYASQPDDKTQWWRMQINARVLNGVLLNRAQTPFAFVAWDNYQAIKGR
ncbi:MAG: hypothetical protein LC725_12620 [Lentisphaerae bacterium]|nr:hypothetical protein [Lentisphaerota bacterium]